MALEIIKKYGADRVLYGTDYPMWSPYNEMKTFMELDLTDEERKLILSENAKKLFW
ncbi:MAG: amidohydrolase family protein [Clostridia bacterium]|nr:amidohydrolase family protein [Clostridia bacterium]